jgi:hypothetical protein
VGTGTLLLAAGRGLEYRRYFRNAAGGRHVGQPLRLERFDHEEYCNADRNGLGKNQPKAAHNLVFSGRKDEAR